MNCPYCNGEMRKGILYFDGRSGAHWNEGDAKQSLSKTIGGLGRVMAAKSYKALSITMTIDSFYCDRCKKMIIDTEISR